MNKVQNRLGDFEFHDAVLTYMEHSGDVLVLDAAELNVHQDCDQNPFDCDMEIKQARLTFTGFRLDCYTSGGSWVRDASGEFHPSDPIVYLKGASAMESLLNELHSHITVFHLAEEGRGWKLDGCGEEPWFQIHFQFDSVEIAWDEFRRPAWYVLHQRGIKA